MNNRLKELRKKKHISQYKLAELANCSQPTIAQIENGKIDLSTYWMKIFSDILDCKPYELLPEEWQPPVLTEDEQMLLKLFRKKTTGSEE